MLRNLYIYCFLLALLPSLPVMGQVRHVTTVNPMSPNQSRYVQVYEYDYVDVQPQFPGGERGLMNFINKTREYPYDAYRNRIQGRVVCSFIVGTDGKVSNIQIIKSAGNDLLNREAMRVIAEMPKWKPGKVGRSKVPVRVVLPIAFRL